MSAIEPRLWKFEARQAENRVQRHAECLVSSSPGHGEVAGFVKDQQRQSGGHASESRKATANRAREHQCRDGKDHQLT